MQQLISSFIEDFPRGNGFLGGWGHKRPAVWVGVGLVVLFSLETAAFEVNPFPSTPSSERDCSEHAGQEQRRLYTWMRQRAEFIQAIRDNEEDTCWDVFTDQAAKEAFIYNGQRALLVAQQAALQGAIYLKTAQCTAGCSVPGISVARSLCISRCIAATTAFEVAALAALAVELEWVIQSYRDDMETHVSDREGCLENAQHRYENRRRANMLRFDHYTYKINRELLKCRNRVVR